MDWYNVNHHCDGFYYQSPRQNGKSEVWSSYNITDYGYKPLNPFKVGDIVKLKTGSSPQEVTHSSAHGIATRYVNGTHHQGGRSWKDYEYHDDHFNQAEEKETEDMATLYEVKQGEQVTYAHKLAVNSKGEWVMEPKGGGDIFSVNKGSVEEVLPYTVDIKFDGNNVTYSYLSEAGKFSVGDVIKMPDSGYGASFAEVVKVDSKSKKTTKELKPIYRVLVERF